MMLDAMHDAMPGALLGDELSKARTYVRTNGRTNERIQDSQRNSHHTYRARDELMESDLEMARWLASRPYRIHTDFALIGEAEQRKRDYDQETERLRLMIHQREGATT